MGKKVTKEEAEKRLAHRTDVVLVEFFSWKTKARFYDKIIKDWFWSIPADVLRHNIVHPARRMEKKKATNLKNWGVENPTQSNIIKEKIKKTNLKKYGKEHYLQTNDKRKKSKKTCLEKYGVEHHTKANSVKEKTKATNIKKYGVSNPQQNKQIKEKTKKTFLKRYGVENPSQVEVFKKKKRNTSMKNWGVEQPLSSLSVRNKAKETYRKKFGVEHPMLSPKIKEKMIKTVNDRYGVTHWSKSTEFKLQISKKKVKETGEWVVDWLSGVDEPKPSYITLLQKFVGDVEIPIQDLEKYLMEFRSAKSSLEMKAEQLFETKYFNKKPEKIRSLYRPDFRLSPHIFVNVDGLYWHSEAVQQDQKYHFNLRKEFENAGLRIFQFREDEIRDKPQIVKSIVNNSLGKTKNRLFARKCKVQTVKQPKATVFLEENHLMGSTNAKHLGLYHDSKLVSLLSYKQTKNVCKIERFCSTLDTNIVGGFSKLLSHLEKYCLKPNIKEIHNWVDLRYGTGIHLKPKGFEIAKETLGWKWTDFKTTYNRLKCKANMDNRNLTQQQHANELGWYKIYDAGQRLWVKQIGKKICQSPT